MAFRCDVWEVGRLRMADWVLAGGVADSLAVAGAVVGQADAVRGGGDGGGRCGRLWSGECSQPPGGGDQGGLPGPGSGQVQDGAAAAVGEAGGDVQQAVAEAFRLAAAKLTVQQQGLCPGDRVLADQDQLQPCLVGGEVAEGEVAQPGVFGRSDAVFDAGAVAVAQLEGGDVCVWLVGDEDLEAVAVVVGEGELGAGVGPLAAADHACRLGPAGRGRVERELHTQAPSRTSPLGSTAGVQAASGIVRIAALTGSVRS